MKRAAVIVIVLLFALALLVLVPRWSGPALVEKTQPADSTAAQAQGDSQPSNAPTAAPPNPNATPEEGRVATEQVARMVTAFHTRMGENPVGTNAEITKALMGGNPVHATFAADPPSLNAKGELLDPWGTPYFFHQLSGNEMEIHSAGPDKIMGTQDDIVEHFTSSR